MWRTCSILILLAMSGLARAATTSPATTPAPIKFTTTTSSATQPVRAAVVVLEGVIDEYSRDSLFKRFDKAKADGAQTIILKLNTPGGLVSAAMDITRMLRGQSDVKTIAFVHHQA